MLVDADRGATIRRMMPMLLSSNPSAARVAGSQEYEVEYFAKHHGIGLDQARSVLERFGHDRQALLGEVARLKYLITK